MSTPPPPPPALRDLLHDLADDQPPVHVAPDTWARGRRSHRRRLAATSAVTAAAVALVAVGGTTLVRDATSTSPDVAGGRLAPALPTDLYGVPEEFAPGRDEAGTDPWAEEVRTGTLAVGVTAAVLPVGYQGLVAVSGTDGRYRGLDLPGLWTDGMFREQAGIATLSPDGARLAYAWGEPELDANGDPTGSALPDRSGVRILDLTTGQVTDHPIPSRFGVETFGFGWSPSGRWLAYGISTFGNTVSGATVSRDFRTERLDTRTGERTRFDLQPPETRSTINDRGEVATLQDGGLIAPGPRGEPTGPLRLPSDGELVGLGWSPDGRALAASTFDGRVRTVAAPGRGTDGRDQPGPGGRAAQDVDGRVVPPGQGDDASEVVRLLGWTDAQRLVVGIDNVDTLRVVDLRPDSLQDGRLPSRPLVALHGVFGASLQPGTLSLATDLLDEPTRDYPAPAWVGPWWDGPAGWVTGAGVVALLVLGASAVRRRRTGP